VHSAGHNCREDVEAYIAMEVTHGAVRRSLSCPASFTAEASSAGSPCALAVPLGTKRG